MEIEKLQAEYDSLRANVDYAKEEMSNFEVNLLSKGLYTKNGKVLSNDMAWGIFWDIDYYSHFDGHTSDAIYEEYKGAKVLTSGETQDILEFILEWNKLTTIQDKQESLSEFEFPNGVPYVFYNEIERICDADIKKLKFENNTFLAGKRGIKIEVISDNVQFSIINGGHDQNQCLDGSFIEFKITNKSDIEIIKIIKTESRG